MRRHDEVEGNVRNRMCRLLLAPLLCATSTSGCVVAAAASVSGGVDTARNPSSEGRLELYAAIGDEDMEMYVALGLGGGYYGAVAPGATETGFFLFTPEFGLGWGGRDVYWRVGLDYIGRVGGSRGARVHSGGGGVAAVYFRLSPNSGESAHLAIGPRLSIEAFDDFSGNGVTVFSLGLVLRAVVFDMTSPDGDM